MYDNLMEKYNDFISMLYNLTTRSINAVVYLDFLTQTLTRLLVASVRYLDTCPFPRTLIKIQTAVFPNCYLIQLLSKLKQNLVIMPQTKRSTVTIHDSDDILDSNDI